MFIIVSERGNAFGEISQGLGLALMENLRLEDGTVINPNLGDYKIPSFRDIPTIGLTFVNSADPLGPFGAKGIGEPAIGAGSGSVLCAIADALGGDGHFYRSPVTADMVLAKLEQIAPAHGRLMNHV